MKRRWLLLIVTGIVLVVHARAKDGDFLFYDDGPTASIAVKHTRGNDGRAQRSIFTNGKSDGAIWQDYRPSCSGRNGKRIW